MALTLSPRTPPTTMSVQSIHQHHATFPNRNTANSNNRNFLPPIHLHRSPPPSASNSCRCRAVSPGRQPPPESEPPNGKDPSPSEGTLFLIVLLCSNLLFNIFSGGLVEFLNGRYYLTGIFISRFTFCRVQLGLQTS